LFDLKIDPKLPYHYLITVQMHSMNSKTPGKMFLKHGPLNFTNDDVENVRSSLILSNDRLFKTDQKQALENFNCSPIAGAIRGIQLAANANQCTTHHFSSQYEINDEWFVNLVDLANTSEHNKELLEKSKVR
jgi:hypothetical protein